MEFLWKYETYFWSEAKICVAREITKKFEEFCRGNISEVREFFQKNPSKVKWEFVIIF